MKKIEFFADIAEDMDELIYISSAAVLRILKERYADPKSNNAWKSMEAYRMPKKYNQPLSLHIPGFYDRDAMCMERGQRIFLYQKKDVFFFVLSSFPNLVFTTDSIDDFEFIGPSGTIKNKKRNVYNLF